MCGIAGFWARPGRWTSPAMQETAAAMADSLTHRGPDASGVWTDPEQGVALGHRRLSIIDLSEQGCQPMESACGRYVLVFNGEIYNFQQLHDRLERSGARFRGSSDTEVLLTAMAEWGVAEAMKEATGMFAFALWDGREHRLHLGRDRLGEKPLYYCHHGDELLFSSELKAFRQYPGWHGEVDRDALTLLLRHAYVPSSHSIYRGVHKVKPGTILSFDRRRSLDTPERTEYWSAWDAVTRGLADPLTVSEDEAVDQLEALLSDAIGQQMIADVPLGALLSGGLDSSTVVALMQAQSASPVRTFTIGFEESGFDEAVYAERVARHLGTDHTELYVSAEEARSVIPQLPALYDEPFADPSQIPTFLVARMARRHVTVCLSGDGGDELFGGYNRYFHGRRIWQAMRRLPPPARRLVARVLRSVRPATWDSIAAGLERTVPRWPRLAQAGDRVHKLAGMVGVDSAEEMYTALTSHWKSPEQLVVGAGPDAGTPRYDPRAAGLDFTRWMLFTDTVGYLPDDILTKVDRALMGVSLEGRIPFLDHRVVEFAARVPMSMKIRGGQGKWILREVLRRHVPLELIDRPKMGFGVPIGDWLRGPLRDWAESLLDEQQMKQQGYLNPAPVRAVWREHLSGRFNHQYPLWNVLMFQAWLETADSVPRPAEQIFEATSA